MTYLLDANVLIALTNQSHVHHSRARRWFGSERAKFATCPITQGALVRHYLRDAENPDIDDAFQILRGIESLPDHEFWPDSLPYINVRMVGVIGHRQVTDAYLVSLAESRGGQLASMDKGLSLLHSDKVLFIE
jgi:toxin-antitoxin system PIN domain toxin